MSTYVAARSWPEETARLGALERALDDHTRRYLDTLGVSPGMRCLEIGAGSGSIAAWLAGRVGADGAVVATDLDTALLEPLRARFANLTVQRANIAEGAPRAPDGGGFDLVHARLVLGHVADRESALRQIVSALRPRGWAVIEDADFLWTDIGRQPLHPVAACEPYFRVWQAVVELLRERGYAVHWGRQLASALRTAGLVDVAGEAVTLVGNTDLQAAMRATVERFGSELVRDGRLPAAALAECLAWLADPELTFTGSPMFSVWGRRRG